MVANQAMAEFERLIPTLVELGLKNAGALQEVQARQVIYGGDQQTNLLEMGLVAETDLLAVLSRIEELPPYPPGPVLLDLDLTMRLRSSGVAGVAGARKDGTVAIAVSARPRVDAERLSQILGEPCELLITSTPRLQEAILMFNGEQVPARLDTLLDKLGKRLTLSQEELNRRSSIPPPAVAPPLHVPVEVRTLSLSEAHGLLADTAPPPLGYEDITAFSGVPSSMGNRERPRNTYASSEAISDLTAASHRERIVEILIHFASSQCEYVAAFAVAAHEARGLRASGPGASTEIVKRLVIPLDLDSALKTALSLPDGHLTRLRASGLEGGVARDLERPVGRNVLLYPILLQQRPVLLLLCDARMEKTLLAAQQALKSVAAHVTDALKRVLLEKKRATRAPLALDTPSQAPGAAPDLFAPVPSRSSVPARASAPPLPTSSIPPAEDGFRSSPTKIGITSLSPRKLLEAMAEPHTNTRRNPAAPPQMSTAAPAPAHEPAHAPKRSLSKSDPPESFPPEPPRTLKGFPKSQRNEPQLRAPLMSRRIIAVGRGDAAVEPIDPSEAANAGDSPPEMSTTGTMLSRRPLFFDPASMVEEDSAADNDAAAPARAPSDPKRPRSFSDLVAELLNGNDSVMPQLLGGGESAIGALIAEFPGPVTEPESPSEKASECGPILSALVSIGSRSVPFVTVRTADENARVRRWATFVLGELPGKESAKAIANRLLDGSIEVRRAALSSARRVRRDPLTRRTLRAQVEQMCRDQSLDPEARCSAIEALADIREHEAIPVLLQLLEDFDASVARSARWAMCVLTRQDFGDDIEAWRQFWQQHRDEDRVEWLIASLDHEQRDIRRAAGDELRALCGKDFGYDEDQVQSERRKAQADFRSWWLETGKAKLH